jgi:hypothetical protein
MAVMLSCGGPANPLYKSWRNFPQSPSFFPITAWLQNPNATGVVTGKTVAQAAADCGINILIAVDDGGVPWPPSFGTDDGRLQAIADAGLYLIAGANTGMTTANNTARDSAASFIALNATIGDGRRIIGYNLGDEPACGAPMNAAPGLATAVAGYDPTRPSFHNKLGEYYRRPVFYCASALDAATKAVGVESQDIYPLLNPYLNFVSGGDHISVPQDSLYVAGLIMQTMRAYARDGQPLWAFIAGGSDALNFSPANNFFNGSIENGSANLTFVSKDNGIPTKFTAAWVGLTLSGTGIPVGAVVGSITDDTHLVMSQNATATRTSVVTVTGGANNDCVASGNICVVNSNRYRATPAELEAEVWINIVNGANGIQWFVHDNTSFAYSFGAIAGGAGAQVAKGALTHINGVLKSYAAILNATTVGICSMDSMNPVTGDGNPTVAASCSSGILTMATDTASVPGAALAKSYQGVTYLFAQPSRRGSATMTFTLTGLAGQRATVIYDTNSRYSSGNNSEGTKFTLNGSAQFSDTFGANSNHYQTKIYAIQ